MDKYEESLRKYNNLYHIIIPDILNFAVAEETFNGKLSYKTIHRINYAFELLRQNYNMINNLPADASMHDAISLKSYLHYIFKYDLTSVIKYMNQLQNSSNQST